MKAERARPLIKIMSVKTAEHAGTLLCLTLHMVNTKTMGHVFRHPKYYEELRKIRKQEGTRPAPDPIVVTEEDLKALEEIDKQQAEASSTKQEGDKNEQQASSSKRQASEQDSN